MTDHPTDLPALLAELDAAVEKMTPGPWFDVENDLIGGRCVRTTERKPSWDNGPEESSQTVFDLGVRDEDFAGIVALVNAYPQLREGIAALQRRVEHLGPLPDETWQEELDRALEERDALRTRGAQLEAVLKKLTASHVVNSTMAYVYVRIDADVWRQLLAAVRETPKTTRED